MWALPFIESRNCRLISQEQEMTPSLTPHQFLGGSGKGNKKELKFGEKSQVMYSGEMSIVIQLESEKQYPMGYNIDISR